MELDFKVCFGIKFVEKKGRVFEIAEIHLGKVDDFDICMTIEYHGDFKIRFKKSSDPVSKIGLREVGTNNLNFVTPEKLAEYLDRKILKKL